jgi:hypothetical protein
VVGRKKTGVPSRWGARDGGSRGLLRYAILLHMYRVWNSASLYIYIRVDIYRVWNSAGVDLVSRRIAVHHLSTVHPDAVLLELHIC